MITPHISGKDAAFRLLRASLHVRRSELRIRLEYWVFELLESCAVGDRDRIARSLSVASELIAFAEQINELDPISYQELISSLEGIEEKWKDMKELKKEDISENFPIRQNTAKEENINTAIRQKKEILENNTAIYGNNSYKKEKEVSSNSTEKEVEKESRGFSHLLSGETFSSEDPRSSYLDEAPIISSSETIKNSEREEDLDNNSPRTIMRQSAILRRVRESGGLGCRLKELIEEFPQVSERTLRYDLERLINQGHIIRVGQGPVSTYLSKS